MSSFGEKLREERERRNTAIEEIAGTTKIQLSYLEALEHNEFDALPGPAFGKLYIRAYAEVLGFDPRPLIDDYDRERQDRVSKESSRGRTKRPGPMAPEERARARQARFAKVVGGEHARPRSPEPAEDRGAGISHEVESREAVEEKTNQSEDEQSVEPGAIRCPAADDDLHAMTATAEPPPAPTRTREEARLVTPDHEQEQMPETDASNDTDDAVESGEPELPVETQGIDDSSVAKVEAPDPGLEPDSARELDPPPPQSAHADVVLDVAATVEVAATRLEDHPPTKPSSLGLPIAVVAATILLAVIVWISLGDRPSEAQPAVPSVAEAAERTGAITEPEKAVAALPETGQATGDPRDPASEQPVAAPPSKPVRVPPDAALAAPSSNDLSVTEFGVGRRVVNHRLEGRGDHFEEGSVVWFSTRVLGGTSGEPIRHVWFRNGKAVQSIELPLGGPHWRTHSQKTLWGIGSWSVEARDASGAVLARTEFSCVP